MHIKNKIIVIGDIMLDHYVYGKCERISPEAPVPIVNLSKETYTLGGAGNVIKNLCALGAESMLFSVSGEDDAAFRMENELGDLAITTFHLVKEKERPTTVKTRVLAGNHQMLRIDKESKTTISDQSASLLIDQLKVHIQEAKVLILSDYCKGIFSEELTRQIIALCKEHGVSSLLDSKEKNLSKFGGVDIVKPNKKEAALMAGIAIDNHENLKQACSIIAQKANCQSVVVTLSEEGMAIYHNEALEIVPTKALEVYDVTGAGDTVIATIAYGLANGLSLHNACDLANHAAAVVVGKIGSATATLEEIEAIRKKQN